MTTSPSKTVVLDSSTVNDLARDVEDPSAPGHRDACSLFEVLSSGGWVPALSLLQINEIAQHDSAGVVAQRARFLERLPRVAWLRNTLMDPRCPETIHYGSVLDLLFQEAVAWQPGMSAGDVSGAIRPAVLIFASDGGFIRAMVRNAALSRQMLGSDQHARSVATLTHALHRVNPNLTLAQLRRVRPANPAYAARKFDAFAKSLIRLVGESRDKRAQRLPEAVEETLSSIAQGAAQLAPKAGTPQWLEAVLAQHGLDPSDVDDSMTIRDVGELGAFRANMRMLFESRGQDIKQARLTRLRPEFLPSSRLSNALRRMQTDCGERPTGSDLLDAGIAPMGLYTDAIVVDKRTHEYLGRIRRNDPELNTTLGPVAKWSGPANLCAFLHRQ